MTASAPGRKRLSCIRKLFSVYSNMSSSQPDSPMIQGSQLIELIHISLHCIEWGLVPFTCIETLDDLAHCSSALFHRLKWMSWSSNLFKERSWHWYTGHVNKLLSLDEASWPTADVLTHSFLFPHPIPLQPQSLRQPETSCKKTRTKVTLWLTNSCEYRMVP